MFPQHRPHDAHVVTRRRARPCPGNRLVERTMGRRVYASPCLVDYAIHVVERRGAWHSCSSARSIVWAFFFHRWYRDHPRDHPAVNAAERALIAASDDDGGNAPAEHPMPWRIFVGSPTVLLLCLQYLCKCYGWWFYITWLPRYLRDARGVELTKGAMLAALPLFLGGIGAFLSGAIASLLARWVGSVALSRRLLAGVGVSGASALLLLSVSIRDPLLAMLVIGMAGFCNDLAVPPSWAACMDVGGRYAGTLAGTMNMVGNLGGGLAPIATGMILERTGGNWAATFYLSAALYALATACWLFIDPVTSLDTRAASVRISKAAHRRATRH